MTTKVHAKLFPPSSHCLFRKLAHILSPLSLLSAQSTLPLILNLTNQKSRSHLTHAGQIELLSMKFENKNENFNQP